ncbi:MAG TPA: TonB family protein, partial [bacterium]|nr:TonB family protein [bacterium]
ILLFVLFVIAGGADDDDFLESTVTGVELVDVPSAPPEADAPVTLPEKPPEEPEPEAEPEPEPALKPQPVVRKLPAADSGPIEPRLEERLKQRLAGVTAPAAAARPVSSGSAAVQTGTWYHTYIQQRMYSLWKQPSRSLVKQPRATAVVSFRVYRDGHIENIRISRSSGSRVMDDSVLEAVRLADPLIPPTGQEKRYEEYELLFELKE